MEPEPAAQGVDVFESDFLRSEFLSTIRQALAPYAEAISAFQSHYSEIGNSLHDAFERWQRIATAAFDKYQLNVLALTLAGWTLPDWIEVKQISDLVAKSPQEIDDFMTERFMADDAQNLRKLRDRLLECAGLSQWHILIPEIIDSIRGGRHRVAIPATFTIMEGFIAKALVDIEIMKPKITSPVKVLIRQGWHKQDTYDTVFWKSTMPFLEKLFEDRNFNDAQPTFINRHWTLHGRSSVDWTTADALRLVNSLTAIYFLFETVGCPKTTGA
jgi:hypothetical protein